MIIVIKATIIKVLFAEMYVNVFFLVCVCVCVCVCVDVDVGLCVCVCVRALAVQLCSRAYTNKKTKKN